MHVPCVCVAVERVNNTLQVSNSTTWMFTKKACQLWLCHLCPSPRKIYLSLYTTLPINYIELRDHNLNTHSAISHTPNKLPQTTFPQMRIRTSNDFSFLKRVEEEGEKWMKSRGSRGEEELRCNRETWLAITITLGIEKCYWEVAWALNASLGPRALKRWLNQVRVGWYW